MKSEKGYHIPLYPQYMTISVKGDLARLEKQPGLAGKFKKYPFKVGLRISCLKESFVYAALLHLQILAGGMIVKFDAAMATTICVDTKE